MSSEHRGPLRRARKRIAGRAGDRPGAVVRRGRSRGNGRRALASHIRQYRCHRRRLVMHRHRRAAGAGRAVVVSHSQSYRGVAGRIRTGWRLRECERSPESGSLEPLSIDASDVQFPWPDTVTLWHMAIGGWFAVTVRVTAVPIPTPTPLPPSGFAWIASLCYVPAAVPDAAVNATLHDFLPSAVPTKLSVVGDVKTVTPAGERRSL